TLRLKVACQCRHCRSIGTKAAAEFFLAQKPVKLRVTRRVECLQQCVQLLLVAQFHRDGDCNGRLSRSRRESAEVDRFRCRRLCDGTDSGQPDESGRQQMSVRTHDPSLYPSLRCAVACPRQLVVPAWLSCALKEYPSDEL